MPRGRRKARTEIYFVRVRETIIVEYEVEAESAAAARKMIETPDVPFPADGSRRELETVDWCVEVVELASNWASCTEA